MYTKKNMNCLICGEELKRYQGKYCSVECFDVKRKTYKPTVKIKSGDDFYLEEIIAFLKKIKKQNYNLYEIDIVYLTHYHSIVKPQSYMRIGPEREWNIIVKWVKQKLTEKKNDMENMDNNELPKT